MPLIPSHLSHLIPVMIVSMRVIVWRPADLTPSLCLSLCSFQGGCGASSPARAQDPAELSVTRHGSRSSDPAAAGQAQGETDTLNSGRRLSALSVMPATVGDCPGLLLEFLFLLGIASVLYSLNLVLMRFLQADLACFAFWLRFRLLYVGLICGGAQCHLQRKVMLLP